MFKKRLNSKIDSRASVRLVDEQREILLRMKGRKRMLKKKQPTVGPVSVVFSQSRQTQMFRFQNATFLLQVLDYLLWFLFHTFH